VPKLDLIGTSRLDPLVVEEVVAALRFAVERQFDRDVFSKFPRQLENLAASPRLSSSSTSLMAADRRPARISPSSSATSIRLPFLRTGAMVRRTLVSKTGMSLCLSFLVSSFQRGALDFAEIGHVAFDLAFPFPAPEGTVGALKFYGLETFLAVAPDAERNSVPAEFMLRRIEVDRGKILFTRTLSG
jgi:hypothetical protein